MADRITALAGLSVEDAGLVRQARRVVALAEAARAYVDDNRGTQLDNLALSELLHLVHDQAIDLEGQVADNVRVGEVAHG